jgi:transposase
MTAQVFIQFLSRPINDARQKAFLILDNHRVHHSNIAKEWLKRHIEKIELVFLPSCSPELNPDEYPNENLKQRNHSIMPV